MIRLDTLTKVFPTKIGDTYETWCASYIDSLGAPITVATMMNRRAARHSNETWRTEKNVADQGMGGWGEYHSGKSELGYHPGTIAAVYSRKRKEKAV